MVRIEVVLDEEGLLVSCGVSGHAGAGPRGSDVVCAAVSVLVRAAVRTLSGREGIRVRGDAPERGAFWLETDYSAAGRERLSAVGAFLLEGLRSVTESYPEYCRMSIHTERRK
ncbi:MAG: ribosomal-processing cysteine protease Prp [Spirochaetaceae bacterium]|jgi:uncharacterized protein YsxB (DUF464 family)|nr:ribosomal-processing cysteine protease Prp [Spirochaetaceae bacterium]